MGTEILKSFSHLQNELDEAKSSLKGVDENIKRLIGRDPSELSSSVRVGQKRLTDEKNVRQQFSNKFGRFDNNNENNSKRRNSSTNNVSVFKRLSEKIPDDFLDVPTSRGLISKVIAAPKEVPSRQDVLDKQNKDEKFKDRNRRIFGSLLGTLQKFRQEETKLKKKEEKRTLIEKKIEEHEQQEKEEIKKERQELFINRKRKQQEIKMIELKMLRMKEYAVWEQMQKPRTNFIATKAKPHIHYLPRRMNDKSKILLEESKKTIEEHIEKRKQAVSEELAHIEERMTRNFEPKYNVELVKVEKSVDRHDRHDDGGGSDSELDLDDDVEMKEISPSPEPKSTELIELEVKKQQEKHEEKTITNNSQEEENETDLVQQDENVEHLNNTEKLENGENLDGNAISVINANNSMNTNSELLQKQTEENI